MDYSEGYKLLVEKIKAINEEDIAPIYMPSEHLASEGQSLYLWAMEDKDDLIKRGVTLEMINDLHNGSEALLTAEAIWKHNLESTQEYSKIWSEKLPYSLDLRQEAIATFRYAFRKDQNLLASIEDINSGSSHPDLVSDLHELHLLGTKHIDKLNAIGFEEELIPKLKGSSENMANLLANINGERMRKDKSKLIRDQAFTYLKDVIDEIRACGKFTFRKDPARLKGYRSKYNRAKYIKRKRATEDSNI